MSKIRSLACLALLSVFMALPGCSWFEKHVEPVPPAVITCTGETIPASLVQQVWNDLKTKNYVDLATNVLPLLRDGWNDMRCIIDALETAHPELHEPATEFQRQHAVEIRNAKPLSMDERAAIHISLAAIPTSRPCGEPSAFRSSGEVPARPARGHRVALADSPPGGGPGVVGGGGEGDR